MDQPDKNKSLTLIKDNAVLMKRADASVCGILFCPSDSENWRGLSAGFKCNGGKETLVQERQFCFVKGNNMMEQNEKQEGLNA